MFNLYLSRLEMGYNKFVPVIYALLSCEIVYSLNIDDAQTILCDVRGLSETEMILTFKYHRH
jgi:hypothetical protein